MMVADVGSADTGAIIAAGGLDRVKLHSVSTGLTGDNIPRRLAASGTEHRNHAENRAIYGV
jgi:hypothetical protein